MCLRCGAVMMLDRELRVRGLTDTEAREVETDAGLLRELATLALKVRVVLLARSN